MSMSGIKHPNKIYCRNIPRHVHERELYKLFEEVGRVDRIQYKQNYCFVEYKDEKAVDDAIRKFDGINFFGKKITVQEYHYRGGDPRYRPGILGNGKFDERPGGYSGSDTKYRIIVKDLDSMTSWQDLKDFGRKVGRTVSFADVFASKDASSGKQGVIEFYDYNDYKRALEVLDGDRLNGVKVRVEAEKEVPEPRRSRSRGRDRDRDRRSRSRDRRRSDSRNRRRSRTRSRSRDKRRERERSTERYRRSRSRDRRRSLSKDSRKRDRSDSRRRIRDRSRSKDSRRRSRSRSR